MGRLGEIRLDDGSAVVVESDDVADDDGPSLERVGRGPEAAQHGVETLQSALSRVRPALVAVVDQVRGLPAAPDTVRVDFGIKLSAEAGVVVARTATEANFTISAEWHRDGSRPAAD